MKKLYLAVTNDLTYDQRMHRICGSLAKEYEVVLIGRALKHSLPLKQYPFQQVRLRCWFTKGSLFYAEYNLRLFLYLLFQRVDGICAIDLDTILPCYFVSVIKGAKRFYDAHELFTEMKEVVQRPVVQKIWLGIERFAVPRYKYCYTVGDGLAAEFSKRYKKTFSVIRNVSLKRQPTLDQKPEPFLLYQGAVNEGRGFEQVIPAMRSISIPLVICGDGNFMPELKKLLAKYGVGDKVVLKGMTEPDALWHTTQAAHVGINFTEAEGLNQYLCLPNKFFDYIQAGVPQVTNNYPEYRRINSEYEVAVLIDELVPEKIAEAVNSLLTDTEMYNRLGQNARQAANHLHWEREEAKLLAIYRRALHE